MLHSAPNNGKIDNIESLPTKGISPSVSSISDKAVAIKTGENNSVIKVCNIDKNLYSVVTPDIRTSEVIITATQIEHIKERHPNDQERFAGYFEKILTEPDYIIEANKPFSALILKEIEENNEKLKLIIRLKTSNDPEDFKNSIITFQKIRLKEWNRLIKNKKILYKRKDKS